MKWRPQVDRRTWVLSGLAALLVVAVLVDRGWISSKPPSSHAAPGKKTPPSELERLTRYRAAIAAEAAITSTYATLAPVFAERTALVPTIRNGPISSQRVRDALIEVLPTSVELQEVIVGTPKPIGRGVLSTTVTVRVRSADSSAMESALWAMGDPLQGMRWEAFDLIADRKAQNLSLTGRLAVLVLEAPE